MKKTIFILIILSSFVKSQNLVSNWSFETYTSCPIAGSELPKAVPWFAPDCNSSDYFNSCASPPVNVPYCGGGGGFQYAKNGNAYAGYYFVNGLGTNYREYAQVQLTSPLINTGCYYTEFFANLHNISKLAVNNVAANISSTPYITTGTCTVINAAQHITRYGNPVIKDTLNWVQVAGIYVASGGENYITIGNFKDNLNTKIDTVATFGSWVSYMLIDAVSVYSINPSGVLPWSYRDTAVISGDSVYIGNYLGGGFTSNWYLQGGGFIKSGSGIYVKPTVTSNYIVQFTLCGVPRADTVKVTVIGGAGINELGVRGSELVVSPNPNNGLLTVEILNKDFLLENSEIKIINVLGEVKKIIELKIKNEKLDISELPNGIYFLELVQNGEFILCKKIVKQ